MRGEVETGVVSFFEKHSCEVVSRVGREVRGQRRSF